MSEQEAQFDTDDGLSALCDQGERLFDTLSAFLKLHLAASNDDDDSLPTALSALQELAETSPLGHDGTLNSIIGALQHTRSHAAESTPAKLGRRLLRRYNTTQDPSDLTRAITHLSQAPPDAAVLDDLITAHQERYALCDNYSDLATLPQLHRRRLALLPEGDCERPRALCDAARASLLLYDLVGNVDALTAGIALLQEALAAGAGQAVCAMPLCEALLARYELAGEGADLAAAIVIAQDALDEVVEEEDQEGYGAEDEEDEAEEMDNTEDEDDDEDEQVPVQVEARLLLARALQMRYHACYELGDLSRAIQLAIDAVRAHGSRGTRPLRVLSGLLFARYLHDLDPEALESYAGLSELLIPLLPEHEQEAESMRLATALFYGSEGKAGGEHLNRCIALVQGVLRTQAWADPARHETTKVLQSMYVARYSGCKHPADLLAAIALGDEAFVLLPPVGELQTAQESAKQAWLLYLLHHRHGQPWTPAATTEIVALLQQAAACEAMEPKDRLHAYITAALTLLRGSPAEKTPALWMQVHAACCAAIEYVHTLGVLPRLDRQAAISALPCLAAYAAASALEAGLPAATALEACEHGRGFINGSFISLRSNANLDELHRLDSGLHDRFVALRVVVDASPSCPVFPADRGYEAARAQRHSDLAALATMLAEIRRLPGLESFNLPAPAPALATLGAHGAVIHVVCTEERSDALLLTTSGVTSVPLPRLKHNDAQFMMYMLQHLPTGSGRTYGQRNKHLSELLSWLWDAAVAPVIAALQEQGLLGAARRPRVWWIGVGILHNAPFHAAGRHTPGCTDNTFSHVVSSAIPSLAALSYARERPFAMPESLLLVSMPNTDGLPELDTAAEVAAITDALPAGVGATVLETPGPESVLRELGAHSAVHFACHGVAAYGDHLGSALVLEGGDLTAGEIAGMGAGRAAGIAYLSACSTSGNGSVLLADEAITVASAWQIGGAGHVCGNMWRVEDAACVKVAGAFWRALFDGEEGEAGEADGVGNEEGHGRVARAFDEAVRRLREKSWKRPLVWAQFVHMGA